MKHYIEEEWQLYVNDLVEEDARNKMENHLESCDNCFETYMNAINSKVIDKSKEFIGVKFTEKIMNRIESEYIYNKKQLRYSKKIFVYYTSAACITLFLMGSGAFNTILNTIPSTTAAIVNAPMKIEASIGKINFDNFGNDNFKLTNIFKIK